MAEFGYWVEEYLQMRANVMFLRFIISLSLVLVSVRVIAQEPAAVPRPTKVEVASEELETVITEGRRLNDKLAMIQVESRGAMLLSYFHPDQSNDLFLALWKSATEDVNKDFHRDEALDVILRFLFPRNPKLAKQLLGEEPKFAESRRTELRRRYTLASELIDIDPAAASALLEQSLSSGVSPLGLRALDKLRDRDPLLADFVVSKTLDGLRSQPSLVSLTGLNLLTDFIFPASSMSEVDTSLQSLQIQYFSTAYDVFKASLAESVERHYTGPALRARSVYQAQLAMILSALAPRYQPALAQEMSGFAQKLSAQIPPNLSQLSQIAAARVGGNLVSDNPEGAMSLALSTGDFDEANRIVDTLKDDAIKKRYSQLIIKLQAKGLLAKSDVLGALTLIRKIEDQNARLGYYLRAVAAAQKKRDLPILNIVVNEARTGIPQVDRNGLHVRLLLSFTSALTQNSPDDAAEFLRSAVSALNSLGGKSTTETNPKSGTEIALAELNDPSSFVDSQELENAFSSNGVIDLDRALIEARRIEFKPAQLVARLEAIQETVKNESRKPKSRTSVPTFVPRTSRPSTQQPMPHSH